MKTNILCMTNYRLLHFCAIRPSWTGGSSLFALLVFVTLTTLSQAPVRPVSPSVSKKRNAGWPASELLHLAQAESPRSVLPCKNAHKTEGFVGSQKAMRISWNPHRFHWLRSWFNLRSSSHAPCSCAAVSLHHDQLSGVHPLLHQFRDQQSDLSYNHHTRKNDRHQNTCVQHNNLSLLIDPLGCVVSFVKWSLWFFLTLSLFFLQNVRFIYPCCTNHQFVLFHKTGLLFFSTFTVSQPSTRFLSLTMVEL